MTLPEIAAATAICSALLGLVWNASTLASDLKALKKQREEDQVAAAKQRQEDQAAFNKWREKHEPTVVELVELKGLMSGLVGQVTDIKADIQRLYDRKPTQGGR